MLHPGPHPDAVKSRGEVQQRGQALAARNKKKSAGADLYVTPRSACRASACQARAL